jgi:hypothetical protein
VLVRGEVRKSQLDQIARDEIGKTLAARIVPALVWPEDDRGGSFVLAPKEPLFPQTPYTLASAEPRVVIPFVVAPDDGVPTLPRVWPPVGSSGTNRLGVFCGGAPLPPITIPAVLDPGGPAGVFVTRGAAEDNVGKGCVRFEAEPSSASFELSPSPLLELRGEGEGEGEGASVRLDPRPFVVDEGAEVAVPLVCDPSEMPFGPGCAKLADDRLFARAPKAPLFWAIAGADLDTVFTTDARDPFTLTGLPPEQTVELEVLTIDVRGALSRALFVATTLPPSPHVIINEVLANPLGAEPDQEWIELYNDGQLTASLAGFVIADLGGETVLPDVPLAPGQFALVVRQSFVEDDSVDVSPAPNVTLIHVPQIGRSGIGNAGEPLKLTDNAGNVVSRFPPLPKPKAGMSVARTAPAAPDGHAASFVIAAPSPGWSNEF